MKVRVPIVQKKRWTELDKVALDRVWSSYTLYSYTKGKVRWYVFAWSPTHRMHYSFTYTDTTAIFDYFITETRPKKDNEQWVPPAFY